MPKVSDEHLRARRQEILDGAARCFARAGFHRTTIQDIAAESGLSPGLVYRYFADKEDMVAAIAGQWQERRAEQLLHTDVRAPGALGDVASGYLGLLRSLAEPAERDRTRLGVQIWAEALRSPRVQAVAREGVDAPREVLTGLIRAAQERGDLRADLPPDGLIRVLIAIYQGLALQTAWDADLDHDAYVRAVEVLIGELT
ncbi:TetR/AcrR family transcriptional regulator [Actinoallomurus bryophytorum]|uniref:TetR family transcriptional regulator n=1 Tax=Actinoallomurus bryophytorum TaxID=1490222 RepID=A0A543C1F1_9ACTN|nr:TetR/AcrR family transcriptional regulator [Actinoallomurus bryophytorum]TQL90902.1 TetR family transcriptional regulator [Actinoallomurus bryophytorum]